ncbi:MAG: hypothetical protein JW915_22090 [Chitinispirillaceae bacterium]|nr:hypothetical protein [Chitinispirillaceae bacterium]
MEIKGIEFRQYDSNGNTWPGDTVFSKRRRKNSQNTKRPVSAMTFDMLDLNVRTVENDIALLSDLVKSLPDEYVRDRMSQVKDVYPIIDDYLVEKLIMEEL